MLHHFFRLALGVIPEHALDGRPQIACAEIPQQLPSILGILDHLQAGESRVSAHALGLDPLSLLASLRFRGRFRERMRAGVLHRVSAANPVRILFPAACADAGMWCRGVGCDEKNLFLHRIT